MKFITVAAAVALALPLLLAADTGVLIPGDRNEPDPSVFSLNEMSVDVRIDNGVARVRIRQIFLNHVGSNLEGTYQFALPENATISDFAVWDDVTRIPGVILERRRAGEIYNIAKAQTIDPGLLQMGEREASEAARSPLFTAKIVPIPAYGTKRVELEYQEPVTFDHFLSEFAVPLKASEDRVQTSGRLTITIELESAHAIRGFDFVSKSYAMKITERGPKRVKAEFSGANIALADDLAFRFGLDPSDARPVSVITERENGEGFFGASALLPMETARASANAPHTVAVLFDTSLSMQWDKLERGFQACETLLRGLRPADSFSLLLFNSEVTAFATAPRPATIANIEAALTFIRDSRIRGGTDLKKVIEAGLTQLASPRGDTYLVLITDGGATEGTIHNGKLAAWYEGEWNKIPVQRRPHTFVLGVGDDANVALLQLLAANGGVFEQVRSTESLDFKLGAFTAKIGRQPVKELALTAAPAGNFDFVYALEDVRFGGSMASWVGQYKKPLQHAAFTVRGNQDGRALRLPVTAALPATEADHPFLPRLWARARVDALLAKIEREGEDRATIDEIIRLSKKYKFVTPYTSFLAAPRALLRPRVIRPGDPVLRIHTDASISSVIALFPFGLVKPLRYLPSEDAWQTRFLAPASMSDGTYQVRLILRDRAGHVYRESKSFVIASKTPVITAKLDKTRVRRGEAIRIAANSTGTARTLIARMYGAMPVSLHWSSAAKANVGELRPSNDLPPGKYIIHITAEDVAHNVGNWEAPIEIW